MSEIPVTKEAGWLSKTFGRASSKKTHDVRQHLILGIAGAWLIASGFNDAQTYGWSDSSWKIATGAFNVIRNSWQLGLFALTTSARRNINQILSNKISALTNIPQIIGGFLTGELADSGAAGIATTTYATRAAIYENRVKREKNGELAKPTRLREIFEKHGGKVPGLAMAARGAVQVITSPVAGTCYILAGHFMFHADLNGRIRDGEPPRSLTEADLKRQQPSLTPGKAIKIATMDTAPKFS